MILSRLAVAAATLLAFASAASADGEQRMAAIGDLPLAAGGTLFDCRIGYRTFGTMAANGANVVLIPTWFLGKSGEWADMIQRDRLVDSRKYFVVVVDALGNGVSSSPSNCPRQSRAAFPAVSTRDMVESQVRLLRDHLGVRHLKAVVGVSMGGMQAFEWVAAYPDFVNRAVPIVGTPQVSAADLTLWRGGLALTENAARFPDQRERWMGQFGYLLAAVLTSTHHIDVTVPRDQAIKAAEDIATGMASLDPYDVAAQLRAIIGHDVYARYGSETVLKGRLRTKMLIVPSLQDRCVDPAPALAWAKAFRTQTLVIDSDGGHNAVGMEIKRLAKAVERFLDGK